MKMKREIIGAGLVLWVLGLLSGARASKLLPGELSLSPGVVLAIALLASIGNFVALYRMVHRFDSSVS